MGYMAAHRDGGKPAPRKAEPAVTVTPEGSAILARAVMLRGQHQQASKALQALHAASPASPAPSSLSAEIARCHAALEVLSSLPIPASGPVHAMLKADLVGMADHVAKYSGLVKGE